MFFHVAQRHLILKEIHVSPNHDRTSSGPIKTWLLTVQTHSQECWGVYIWSSGIQHKIFGYRTLECCGLQSWASMNHHFSDMSQGWCSNLGLGDFDTTLILLVRPYIPFTFLPHPPDTWSSSPFPLYGWSVPFKSSVHQRVWWLLLQLAPTTSWLQLRTAPLAMAAWIWMGYVRHWPSSL